MGKKVYGRLYQIWAYDLIANEYDSYSVNDRFKDSIVFIPNSVMEGKDSALIGYLKRIDELDKNAKVKDFEISGEPEYTMYFDYEGDPSFEMEQLVDCYRVNGKYYDLGGTLILFEKYY